MNSSNESMRQPYKGELSLFQFINEIHIVCFMKLKIPNLAAGALSDIMLVVVKNCFRCRLGKVMKLLFVIAGRTKTSTR